MNDIEFQKRIDKYLWKPFAVGDKGKGWDCLNSLRDYFENLGIEFPDKFLDWTWENYAERWNKGEGNEVLYSFIMSLGRPIDLGFIDIGDIIIFVRHGYTSLGQYVGNGNFKAHHPERGCIVLPLKFFSISIPKGGIRRLT